MGWRADCKAEVIPAQHLVPKLCLGMPLSGQLRWLPVSRLHQNFAIA
jgi:hypothetical protein